MTLHLRAIPLVLDGLLRGIGLFALLLLFGFVGLAGHIGLGSASFPILGIVVPILTAAIYTLPRLRGKWGPARWTSSWLTLYTVFLAGIVVLYFVSGALVYGHTYFWYDIFSGTLFIAVMTVVLEVVYAALRKSPRAVRIGTLAGSLLLGSLVFLLLL